MGRALELSQPDSPKPSTLLGLVQELLDEVPGDDVVALARERVASRQVELVGNFRGCRQLD